MSCLYLRVFMNFLQKTNKQKKEIIDERWFIFMVFGPDHERLPGNHKWDLWPWAISNSPHFPVNKNTQEAVLGFFAPITWRQGHFALLDDEKLKIFSCIFCCISHKAFEHLGLACKRMFQSKFCLATCLSNTNVNSVPLNPQGNF